MSIGTPKQPTNAPITEAARRDPVDPGRKRWQIRFPKALRTPLGFVGAGILVIWLLVAIFAPLLAPFDPLAQNFPRLSAPNGENLLGTDTLGRDVLSRILVAARTTLPAAVFVVICSALLGSVLGAIAGYFGRAVDEIIMRIADLVFAFPTIILAMVIAAALGPGLKNAIIAILLVSWPSYARVTRSLVMTARGSEYVIAGRLLGFSAGRSLAREIAPNVISPVVVLAWTAKSPASSPTDCRRHSGGRPCTWSSRARPRSSRSTARSPMVRASVGRSRGRCSRSTSPAVRAVWRICSTISVRR